VKIWEILKRTQRKRNREWKKYKRFIILDFFFASALLVHLLFVFCLAFGWKLVFSLCMEKWLGKTPSFGHHVIIVLLFSIFFFEISSSTPSSFFASLSWNIGTFWSIAIEKTRLFFTFISVCFFNFSFVGLCSLRTSTTVHSSQTLFVPPDEKGENTLLNDDLTTIFWGKIAEMNNWIAFEKKENKWL